jgi:SAM-dependent methyltransferase
MTDSGAPRVIDYEDTDYRSEFWEGKGREYEDRVERIAIHRLLPPTGHRLIEVGAGFGRLAPLYGGYETVVLFDYSRPGLEYARRQHGDEGFLYVAGSIYAMPFAPGVFDTVLMVRVLHHMEDVPAALHSIRGITRRGATFLLEFANKRNLKAIGRWLLRQQSWNPFDLSPVEFVELHFDFHPRYVRRALAQAGFRPGRMLTVSHFRVDPLKQLVPLGLLVALDSFFQHTGAWWQLTPSVFVSSEVLGEDEPAPTGAFWRCPKCQSFDIVESDGSLLCRKCGNTYLRRNGIYDFREPAGQALD